MDRESKDKYMVILRASDNGNVSLSSTTNLTVIVTDVNDNAPVITGALTGQIAENMPEQRILTIHATDRDIGSNADMVFGLLNYFDIFEMDSRSGELRTKKPLDREEQETYVVTVKVIDKGQPPLSQIANVTITVMDIDDNCPVFESPVYRTTIEEGSAIGTSILTVKATDRDIGTNAELDYGILTGNDRGAFRIDPDSGVVTVKGDVDRERENGEYWIKVRAGKQDCGGETVDNSGEGGHVKKNFTFTNVYITVIDVNDNPPRFTNGKEEIIYDNINTTRLFQMNATDADEGPGGQVSYSFSPPEKIKH